MFLFNQTSRERNDRNLYALRGWVKNNGNILSQIKRKNIWGNDFEK